MADEKIRHWCATFFTDPLNKFPKNCRYIIYGSEICPETKREHWQSYMELDKPMRIKQIKKIFEDDTVHLEPRRGTRDQAREYCMKDNDYIEYGKWISGQGHRTDLDQIVEKMIKDKSKLGAIMLEYPSAYCRNKNGLKDIAAEIVKKDIPKFRKIKTTLLCGPTGCGKTRFAMERATYKIQGSQLQWWQDYAGDEIICIDEYNNDIAITEMLALLDGYPLRLNIKGSHTYAAWNEVYITTNLRPEELHSNAKHSHREALLRRLGKIINFWDEVVQR